ncbi:cysteine hydrolase [SAR202 cluster bacterium AD-804-J14_MRT_500m]|nr:cysteine hydrolase [SAR202 cluster bacterium AD-804-J14_MRT_500m]
MDLEIILRRRGIRFVIVLGTITYACVLHTLVDAQVRGYDVVGPSDSVASWDRGLQELTLRIVDLILWVTVTTDQLTNLISNVHDSG